MIYLQSSSLPIGGVGGKSLDGQFKKLMSDTNDYLNSDAASNHEYYVEQKGVKLESVVEVALNKVAKGTSFENNIELISGHSFPDLSVYGRYGVEVKSTEHDQWNTLGNSVLEMRRIKGVEKIYITFGNLGATPISFMSKPYEECLDDIVQTHKPRYSINMRLEDGETIFDKMGVSYDQLRNDKNPLAIVDRYFQINKHCKGRWNIQTEDSENQGVVVSPYGLSFWSDVSDEEKQYCIAYALYHFPEVFKGHYDRYANWLYVARSIIDYHIRDQFSSKGKKELNISNGKSALVPAVFGRVSDCKDLILSFIDDEYAKSYPDAIFSKAHKASKSEEETQSKKNNLLLKWIDEVKKNIPVKNKEEHDNSIDALYTIFFDDGDHSSWLT